MSKLSRKHTHYACTGRKSRLMERMFNVKGVEFIASGLIRRSGKKQGIIHFGQPNTIADRRDCGIPVNVSFPQTGEVVTTRLVPQWRFGHGMRTNAIKKLMRGKERFFITEYRGNLIIEFR